MELAAAQAQIKSAYQKFFSGKTSVSDRAAVLQNGSKFKSVIQGFASNPLAKKVNVKVSSVKLEGANNAKVVYTDQARLGGAPEADRDRGAPERHVEGRVREPLQARRAARHRPARLRAVSSTV